MKSSHNPSNISQLQSAVSSGGQIVRIGVFLWRALSSLPIGRRAHWLPPCCIEGTPGLGAGLCGCWQQHVTLIKTSLVLTSTMLSHHAALQDYEVDIPVPHGIGAELRSYWLQTVREEVDRQCRTQQERWHQEGQDAAAKEAARQQEVSSVLLAYCAQLDGWRPRGVGCLDQRGCSAGRVQA